MNDPRVVRGNTYAAIIANKNEVQPPAPQKKSVKQAVPKKGYKQRVRVQLFRKLTLIRDLSQPHQELSMAEITLPPKQSPL